jgi:GT2 family glycosyltransferase
MIYIVIKRIKFNDFFEYFKIFFHVLKIYINFGLKFKFVMDRNIYEKILKRNSKRYKIDIFVEPYSRINLPGIESLKDLEFDSIANRRIVISDLIFVHRKKESYIHLPNYSPDLIKQFNYLRFFPLFLGVDDNKVLLDLYKFVVNAAPLSNPEMSQIEIIKLNIPILSIKVSHDYKPDKVLDLDSDSYLPDFQFSVTLPKISIVIPSALNPNIYENNKFRLIDQVFELEKYINAEFELIMVVGPEVDKENLAYLRKHYARVVLLEDDKDFNFSKRVNEGIKKSKNDILWILNDDIELNINEVLHKEFQIILEILCRNDTGLVGTFLVNNFNEINHAGIEIKLGVADHFLRGTNFFEKQSLNFFKVREVTGVTGANMFLCKSKTKFFGLFDENYPVNFNDLEISLRFRSKKLTNYVIRSANFIHAESQTRDRKILENDKLLGILSNYGLVAPEDDFKFYLPNCCLNEQLV